MYDRVMVPTDGSEESRRAAARGAELAARFGGHVRALYVVDERYSGPEFGDGEEATERVADLAARRTVEVTTERREDVPADAILDCVAEWDVDLVPTGSTVEPTSDAFRWEAPPSASSERRGCRC